MKHPLKSALIYTRDACRVQNGSAKEQLSACEAYAREHGFIVTGHYDDGGSGLEAGSGLLALSGAIERRECDVIIVRDLARLSRDALRLHLLIRSAAASDIEIIAIEGGAGGGREAVLRRRSHAPAIHQPTDR